MSFLDFEILKYKSKFGLSTVKVSECGCARHCLQRVMSDSTTAADVDRASNDRSLEIKLKLHCTIETAQHHNEPRNITTYTLLK